MKALSRMPPAAQKWNRQARRELLGLVPKAGERPSGALGGGTSMQLDVTDLDHLSQVISHALAPAFLLGAVAGFVAILVGRMNAIIGCAP